VCDRTIDTRDCGVPAFDNSRTEFPAAKALPYFLKTGHDLADGWSLSVSRDNKAGLLGIKTRILKYKLPKDNIRL
jgi:hypothetical protein